MESSPHLKVLEMSRTNLGDSPFLWKIFEALGKASRELTHFSWNDDLKWENFEVETFLKREGDELYFRQLERVELIRPIKSKTRRGEIRSMFE